MRQLFLSVLVLAVVGPWTPVHAASTVFGDAAAQKCYESARFGGGARGQEACDRALRSSRLSKRDRAATLVNRGILLNHQRRVDEAIEDFNAALRLSGPSGEIYLNRGNSNFFRKRIKAALADYTRAIRHRSKDLHIAYFNRGLAYEVLGRFDDARRDYEKALELKPGFGPARASLVALPGGNAPGRPRPSAATG